MNVYFSPPTEIITFTFNKSIENKDASIDLSSSFTLRISG